MSDEIKHECGIAVIRLLKPLHYYQEKYGTPFYGLKKLYLLMQKQHNRGQDGAGMATIKLDVAPGRQYIHRLRATGSGAIQDIFSKINGKLDEIKKAKPEKFKNTDWIKKHAPFAGEVMLGHLRYGTYGKNSMDTCHPFLRQNNWQTRNLVVAGNFNLTNVDELFEKLVELGQHPREKADTITVMEKIGHFLDEENELLFQKFKKAGHTNAEISGLIASNLDVAEVLRNASRKFDGGYAMAGLMGHGDAFVLRDPNGIRPVYWHQDDEVAVIASERAAIQTCFNLPFEDIKEIEPGHAIIIRANGNVTQELINDPGEKRSCSFERIYFSRGNDKNIYQERKALGRYLTPAVVKAIDNDIDNTVFSFIPNTAETAFIGLVDGINMHLDTIKRHEFIQLGGKVADEKMMALLNRRPRVEKIAVKDIKLRTFITDDSHREDLVAHVYDTTYGVVRATDNLVVIDDSIVRGTTLKNSILRILDRLGPKRIIIVSSAPQIRYPDCYGIDMAKMGDFVAFQAVIELIRERNMDELLDEVYEKAKAQMAKPREKSQNVVKAIYEPFTPEEISAKVAQLLTPKEMKADVSVIYQSIEGLHHSCHKHTGDWYFTGNYPTPGGHRVANRAFINYMEGKNVRAY
ncbi:MAG: amidophosphoribosyltransferase [Bacteroidia bacterium]|nr:amidophosphoribosyltransferase [Bacteroidia bacterium]